MTKTRPTHRVGKEERLGGACGVVAQAACGQRGLPGVAHHIVAQAQRPPVRARCIKSQTKKEGENASACIMCRTLPLCGSGVRSDASTQGP